MTDRMAEVPMFATFSWKLSTEKQAWYECAVHYLSRTAVKGMHFFYLIAVAGKVWFQNRHLVASEAAASTPGLFSGLLSGLF